ncbi:hypothetical protein OUZ56_022529 [Daphnia magna]|uniref:Uncharacterized protein n=1 Tax=Daphnia magna TaxID=35525 RepID=A0ABR0AWU2_9CRUS|nr:hypothetical protein OUZ56_022529 [Daphnia magna]
MHHILLYVNLRTTTPWTANPTCLKKIAGPTILTTGVCKKSPFFTSPVIALPVTESPVIALPVIALPVVESPVIALPVAESPVIALPVAESPVIALPVAESPVITLPVAPSSPRPVTPSSHRGRPVVASWSPRHRGSGSAVLPNGLYAMGGTVAQAVWLKVDRRGNAPLGTPPLSMR